MGRLKPKHVAERYYATLSLAATLLVSSPFRSFNTLHQYAEIRTLLAILMFISILIFLYLICANIPRLKIASQNGHKTTETLLQVQAKEYSTLIGFRAWSEMLEKPVKLAIMGLNSSVGDVFANNFLKANKIGSSIYSPFSGLGRSFSLWLTAGMSKLPKMRLKLTTSIHPYIAKPQSVLVNGMVFGDDEGMPETINHSVKVIGMQHVMAASGFNVGLIVTVTKVLIRRFCHPTVVAIFCLAAIMFYVGLIGAPPSAVRAGLMVGYAIVVSSFVRRQFVAWYALAVSAGMMLMVSREYWDSISFQLSVSATLGLILVEPRLSKLGSTWFASIEGVGKQPVTQPPKIASILKETAITTIAAQAFSLPLLLYHFGELSTLSLLANVSLLWLTPLITVGGLGLVALALITQLFPGLVVVPLLYGQLLGLLSKAFLLAIEWLGQFEWTLVTFPSTMPLWAVLAWWTALLLWIFFGKRHAKVVSN